MPTNAVAYKELILLRKPFGSAGNSCRLRLIYMYGERRLLPYVLPLCMETLRQTCSRR